MAAEQAVLGYAAIAVAFAFCRAVANARSPHQRAEPALLMGAFWPLVVLIFAALSLVNGTARMLNDWRRS